MESSRNGDVVRGDPVPALLEVGRGKPAPPRRWRALAHAEAALVQVGQRVLRRAQQVEHLFVDEK